MHLTSHNYKLCKMSLLNCTISLLLHEGILELKREDEEQYQHSGLLGTLVPLIYRNQRIVGFRL